jgi:hypothetical protein
MWGDVTFSTALTTVSRGHAGLSKQQTQSKSLKEPEKTCLTDFQL